MAISYIPRNITRVGVRTFSVDCTTATSGLYTGVKSLSAAEIENAKAIIPINGRAPGSGFIVTTGYENGALRLTSAVSIANVTVTCLFLF